MVSMLISIPAAGADSRAEAWFHNPVAAQDTTTPSTSEPSSSCDGEAESVGATGPVSTASGSMANVITPVPRPTTVDQPAPGTFGLRLRNRALARPYQVQRTTAPSAASTPST